MITDKKIFADGEKNAKLSTGPTLPIPGPTLASEVATEPSEVARSYPIRERAKAPKTNVNK